MTAKPRTLEVGGPGWEVVPIPKREAADLVVAHHYLHRRPPISYAYGLVVNGTTMGVVTYGTPPSRHLQMGACPEDPSKVIELNRMWVHDDLPRNSESWLVSRTLRLLPPRIVVSYADTKEGHQGYVYRSLNFQYAGWTDMDRKTPPVRLRAAGPVQALQGGHPVRRSQAGTPETKGEILDHLREPGGAPTPGRHVRVAVHGLEKDPAPDM